MSDIQNEYDALKKQFEEFTYIVSHDLRAPLRGITSITEWIEDDFDDSINDEIKENFNLLKSRVKKLDLMIAGLVELSRVDTRNNEKSAVDLVALVEDIKEEVLTDHAHVNFLLKVTDEKVTTYQKKLYAVLYELINNSALHNQENITIKVDVKKEEGHLKINVSDDGAGSPEDPEKLSNIFFSTSKSEEHVGLGLAIAQKILQQLKGELTISSTDKGMKTAICWPLN